MLFTKGSYKSMLNLNDVSIQFSLSFTFFNGLILHFFTFCSKI